MAMTADDVAALEQMLLDSGKFTALMARAADGRRPGACCARPRVSGRASTCPSRPATSARLTPPPEAVAAVADHFRRAGFAHPRHARDHDRDLGLEGAVRAALRHRARARVPTTPTRFAPRTPIGSPDRSDADPGRPPAAAHPAGDLADRARSGRIDRPAAGDRSVMPAAVRRRQRAVASHVPWLLPRSAVPVGRGRRGRRLTDEQDPRRVVRRGAGQLRHRRPPGLRRCHERQLRRAWRRAAATAVDGRLAARSRTSCTGRRTCTRS